MRASHLSGSFRFNMAPVGERNDRMGSVGEEEDSESQNLWSTILSEVQSSSASKLPTSKSVLVLGDNECGKTTLIGRLQGVEEPRKGLGLEYFYVTVKDEYRDDQGRLGIWALDGDTNHTGLLKFALTEETFQHTMVVLVASMAHPWSIMDSLERWASVLRHHLDRLRMPPEDRRDYENSMVRFYQEYVEPSDEHSSSSQTTLRRDVNPLHPQAPASAEDDKVLLPLGENILSQNLGIPIVVVITKADAISNLEKEHDFKEEHFDFIQMHIRQFCMSYGAALFYTSVKEDKNCSLLHNYLLHRIYGFPFTAQAYVVEKDSVFIPTGWDNDKKISILHENLQSIKPEDAFDDIIVKPIVRKPVPRDAEVTVEDVQVFLMKQQSYLNKAPSPGQAGDSPIRSPAGAGKPGGGQQLTRGGSSPTPTTATPKKMEGKAGAPGAGNEGMLASFFNSLLNKKTGPGGTPRPDTAGVHAELEKMTKNTTTPAPATTKQTKRAHSDANPNGPSTAS